MGINEYIKVGERIKKMRKAKGIKQKDMAKMLGINVSTYANYENGYREPNLDTIFSISNILDVAVDELIGLEQPEIPLDALETEIEWYHSNEDLFDDNISFECLSENDLKKWERYHEILTRSFLKLNIDGKEEAAKRIEELTHIEKYTKKTPTNR